jgi:uncharacterized protein (DUF427 family)
MTATATWNGAVLAKSDDTVVVEGNHYFRPDDVDMAFFEPSAHHTVCGWKGTASYYDVVVDGQRNENAAWCYPDTKPDAEHVRGRIAFWHGVDVS